MEKEERVKQHIRINKSGKSSLVKEHNRRVNNAIIDAMVTKKDWKPPTQNKKEYTTSPEARRLSREYKLGLIKLKDMANRLGGKDIAKNDPEYNTFKIENAKLMVQYFKIVNEDKELGKTFKAEDEPAPEPSTIEDVISGFESILQEIKDNNYNKDKSADALKRAKKLSKLGDKIKHEQNIKYSIGQKVDELEFKIEHIFDTNKELKSWKQYFDLSYKRADEIGNGFSMGYASSRGLWLGEISFDRLQEKNKKGNERDKKAEEFIEKYKLEPAMYGLDYPNIEQALENMIGTSVYSDDRFKIWFDVEIRDVLNMELSYINFKKDIIDDITYYNRYKDVPVSKIPHHPYRKGSQRSVRELYDNIVSKLKEENIKIIPEEMAYIRSELSRLAK